MLVGQILGHVVYIKLKKAYGFYSVIAEHMHIRGVNRHWFRDSIKIIVNDLIQFDITMHHDYIKFILGIFIKLYKQATFKKKK